MFANLGWDHLLILLIVGLVLGPERVPGAIRWSFDILGQLRGHINRATSDLREEFGPAFDELRVPLGELQRLRGLTPREVVSNHVFDGDDSLFTGRFDDPEPAPAPLPPFDSDAT